MARRFAEREARFDEVASLSHVLAMGRAFVGAFYVAFLASCGGTTPIAEIPPLDEEESFAEQREEADAGASTEENAPVRMALLHLEDGESFELEGDVCVEALAYVVRGRLRDGGATREAGTLVRTQDAFELEAVGEAEVVLSHVRQEGDCVPTDDLSVVGGEVFEQASGARVTILLDEHRGASFGSFAVLENVGAVPEHAHEASSETILVAEGSGTMRIAGEERALRPGDVVHVPAGVHHSASASGAMRVYQVYAPPGPEQRFRGTNSNRSDP